MEALQSPSSSNTFNSNKRQTDRSRGRALHLRPEGRSLSAHSGNPEATALIKFLSVDEGGLKHPIAGDKFKTIIRIDEAYHDCCFYLTKIKSGITAGSTLMLPMDFLVPELVLPKIHPGKIFLVQRGQKVIGHGEIKEVQKPPPV